MSDTPRTDAEVFAVDVAFVSHDGLASEPKNVVEPDFARQLERENANLVNYYIKELSRALAATKKDRDGLEAALLARMIQHSDSIRDSAKQSAAFKIRVGELERENAELRSLLNEAITDHVSRYDLPESEDFIARVKTALGEGQP